jgi:hypothetical protein
MAALRISHMRTTVIPLSSGIFSLCILYASVSHSVHDELIGFHLYNYNE